MAQLVDQAEVSMAYQQALKYGTDLRRVYQAEKARRLELELANQLLSAVFDSTPDGLVVLDHRYRIQQANPAFLHLIEHSTDDIMGRSIEAVFPSGEVIEALRTLQVKDGRPQVEVVLKTPVLRSLLISIAPLRAGQNRGWVLTFHDQTQHKQLEYQKIEFVNIAAHELRTPLTSIVGMGELLLEDLGDTLSESQRQCLEGVLKGGHRLAGIVNELVEFSQLAQGNFLPEIEAEDDLLALVSGIEAELRSYASEKNVTVKLDIAHDIQTEYSSALLRIALYQLMLNGLKYNVENGRVTVSAKQTGGNLVIRVSDTGVGIPRTDLEAIFQLFYQVEDHTIRHVGGLGLGLPIVQRAISELGGKVRVESILGQGTTFTVTLGPPDLQEQPSDEVDLHAVLDANRKQTMAYAHDLQTLYRQSQEHFVETLTAITQALEAHDEYSHGHTERVTALALRLAQQMNYSAKEMGALETACRVHDIGKIGIPGGVLHTADGIPDHEYAITQHIEMGRKILSPLGFLNDVLPIALAHHERFDGQGLPDGLAGQSIPLGARILAVSNDYDVMTSPRPHREALTRDEALSVFCSDGGSQWDPEVVAALVALLADQDEA